MKTNTKIVDLLYEGFSPELIKSLNEKQVEVLHNKLMEGKKKSETKEQSAAGKGSAIVDSRIANAPQTVKKLTDQGVNVQKIGRAHV